MSNIKSEEETEERNVFMTSEAFYQYSQLSQVLDYIVTKDELLKRQLSKTDTDGQQKSPKKPCIKDIKSKDGANKNKKQPTKQAKLSADAGQPKVVIRIPFPRRSWLTKKQHADYLCLSKKFLCNPMFQYRGQDAKELNTFKELQPKVLQEQEEFMSYLKMVASQSVSDYNYIHPEAERFLTDFLKLEQQRVLLYPCFYKLFDDVTLSVQRHVEMFTLRHESILLEMGHVSRIIQPKTGFQNKTSVPLNYNKVKMSFPLSDTEVFKLPPCSQDPNCVTLAKKYNADIVMCASSMACLLDNQAPSYNRQWEMPFKAVILEESSNDTRRHTIFLDKPFVPKILMPREKNEWYHKFATKSLFQHPRHNTSFFLESLKADAGTKQQDQQDSLNHVTEEITELEVFGTDSNSGSQAQLKYFKLPQTENQESLDSSNCVKMPQVDTQVCSTSTECVNVPQADTQNSSASDVHIKEPQAVAQGSSASDHCTEMQQTDTAAMLSVCDNCAKIPQADTQVALSNENNSEIAKSVADDSEKTDLHLDLTDNRADMQLDVVSAMVTQDPGDVMESKTELQQQCVGPTEKIQTDANMKCVNADDKLDNNNCDQDNKCAANHGRDNTHGFPNFDEDDDDDDDAEDGMLVIDVPVTPQKPQKNINNNDERLDSDHQMVTECDPEALVIDSSNTQPHREEIQSPDMSLSPCPDTPLSPQYTPAPNTPAYTPVIPLEKVDMTLSCHSQSPGDTRDPATQPASSVSIPVSPPGDKTVKLEIRHSCGIQDSASGLQTQDVAGLDTDTENELVIDMQSPSDKHQFVSPTIKTELKEDGTLLTSSANEGNDESVVMKDGSPVHQLNPDPIKEEQDLITFEQTVGIKSEPEDQSQTGQASGEVVSSSERVYNLRKRQAALSPKRTSVDNKTEEPKPKRRTRSHTAALPVDGLLRRQTRAMSRQESSRVISQLDGTDDRQTEEVNEKTQAKLPPKIAECSTNLLTSPLDNILDAQSKLLDGSFVASLPSQVSHGPYSDTGQQKMTPAQIPGQAGAVKGQVGFIPEATGSIPRQANILPNQASVIQGQLGMMCGPPGMISGHASGIPGNMNNHDSLYQGGGVENADDYKRPPTSNVSYGLFTLGDLRIIVRFKYHGVLRCGKKKPLEFAHIQPKLEYQPQYGMEQLTYSEICKGWLALQLRPHTSLLRVRINAYTGEIMDQTVLSRTGVIPQQSPFHPGYALGNLHQMLAKLKRLPPGDYLLSHNPGQLSCHIKTTTQSTSGVYDLHKAYIQPSNIMTTQYNDTTVPWIPLDPGLMLPFHSKYQRIPATFEPKDSEAKHTFKPRQKVSKKKKTKKKASA